MNYFALFGLITSYQIDTTILVSRFQALQRKYHPDKFVNSSREEQITALEKSATINYAWQTLRDPLTRAKYLLSLHGFHLFNEYRTVNNEEFLKKQISLREELEIIKKTQDKSLFKEWMYQVKIMFNLYHQKMITEFNTESWESAADTVSKLCFLDELRNSAEELEEELFSL